MTQNHSLTNSDCRLQLMKYENVENTSVQMCKKFFTHYTRWNDSIGQSERANFLGLSWTIFICSYYSTRYSTPDPPERWDLLFFFSWGSART